MNQSISFSKKMIFLLLITTCFIHSPASSQKMQFQLSQIVPAAQGTVEISTNTTKGYNINISILHLASPQRLQPAERTYIVWMDTESNGTKNLGEMQSKDGFLSNTLKANLKTTTPFKPIRIFITAEDVAAISNPHGQQVLTTATFK
jgi:hypothetical protein